MDECNSNIIQCVHRDPDRLKLKTVVRIDVENSEGIKISTNSSIAEFLLMVIERLWRPPSFSNARIESLVPVMAVPW